MIEKIQNFIGDHTSFDVSRNQVMIALVLIVLLITVTVVFLMQPSRPKADPAGFKAPAPSKNLPMHIPGQK